MIYDPAGSGVNAHPPTSDHSVLVATSFATEQHIVRSSSRRQTVICCKHLELYEP